MCARLSLRNATAAGAATAAGTRGRHHGSHTKFDVWQPLWQPLGLNTLCQCNIMKQHATDPDHLPSLPGLLTTSWANALTEPTTHSDAGHRGHSTAKSASRRPQPGLHDDTWQGACNRIKECTCSTYCSLLPGHAGRLVQSNQRGNTARETLRPPTAQAATARSAAQPSERGPCGVRAPGTHACNSAHLRAQMWRG